MDAASSTLAALRRRWDVFLSFRGEDTRHKITQNLYETLEKQGIRVFRDDEGMNRGDEIAPSLLEAIEDSAASIIIISPNYASSHWCLEELARICEIGRLTLPVFYGVDPSNVRKQSGELFEEAFSRHQVRFKEEVVKKWREAMKKVGGRSGWVFDIHNGDEHNLIRLIVKSVLAELSKTPVTMAPYIVGLDSCIEKLMRLLDVKSNGIQVLGLHGIGGVGKTTLAKALYNKLVGHFEYRSFISDVREISGQHDGLISLQNRLIGDISSSQHVNEVNAGITAIKQMVHDKRVLVVLDDVDDTSQLNALAGKREWFCEGSRIIITTRNSEVLHKQFVNQFYEVRELDSSQALQLFSYHALRREKPTDKFLNLSKQIVSLTGQLPLALEVFGSFLLDRRRIEEWKDALEKLKHIRPQELQDVLKISFDGLDEQNKYVFLDIACLFVKMGMTRKDAIDILNGCGFQAEIAITDLTVKSLIKIAEDDYLWMHDQLRDMGRQIVQQEDLVDPGKRSRLWDRDEIMTVLKNHKGTGCIQGIILDIQKQMVKDPRGYTKGRYRNHIQPEPETESPVVLCTKPFESMTSLRLLQINHVKLEGKFKFLPAELKWLQWKGCPLKTLPSDYCPRQLAVLDLSESGIEQIWGSYTNKVAENLMVMNLRGCYNLAAIPDLSMHRNLKKLVLERCYGLVKLHASVGSVSTLLHLEVRECSNLIEFPSDVTGLKHLKSLILSGCSKLNELPEDIGSMRSLKELLVDNTAIAKLPESIFLLEELENLNLNGCQFLKQLPRRIGLLVSLKHLSLDHSALEELPDSVGSLENLEILSLMWCTSLTAIPDSIGNLISLTECFMGGSAIKELPSSIGSLSYLKVLSVGNCKDLSKLPESIKGLASIVDLQLDGTSITDLPDQIGTLKMLEKLWMWNCTSLRALPESTGSMSSLTTLTISEGSITELPESIGMLENLIILRLNKCKQLKKLPASIGKLKSLHHLLMEETAMTELPESFGMLSSLMVLRMSKRPLFRMPENTLTKASTLDTQDKPQSVVLPKSFSNLSLLVELDARAWRISGKIHDDFEKLSSLEILNLGNNNFCSLPSSLRGLSLLKKLLLSHCEELQSLPPLPSSLEEVNAANCIALESVSDLSNLETLEELNLTNCEKVVDIPGLECLKSLRRLYMSGCSASSVAVKRRLSKVYLKNLYNLSMPGNKIPNWFSQDVVSISTRKNREIKAVIIGVVVSLNHQIPDDLRDESPVVPDIKATILNHDETILDTTLYLLGVPKTNEDQVHLCRYPAYHPLVSMLKDGYKIQVIKRDPPILRGVELKKSGIHLVFENDDDFDGDEKSLDESEQSVSERLANFFSSSEDYQASGSGTEVEQRMQEIEGKEERIPSNHRSYFIFSSIILSIITGSVILVTMQRRQPKKTPPQNNKTKKKPT